MRWDVVVILAEDQPLPAMAVGSRSSVRQPPARRPVPAGCARMQHG